MKLPIFWPTDSDIPSMNEFSSLMRGRPGVSRRYAMMDAWHPGVMLAYVGVVVLIACAMPSVPLLIATFLGGSILLFQAENARGVRTMCVALALGCAITVLAPIFDTAGERALFSYFGRPYTFEALMRGALTGLLVASMLVWFACLFRIVSSDGLLRVCGCVAPRIGMVTSLVMQMVPRFAHRAARVSTARIGAGLVPSGSALDARLHEAGAVFATVASDSLERSVVCADAMESRGYGTGQRTVGALKPFALDERAFLVLGAVLAVAFCGISIVHTLSGSPAASFASFGAYALLVFLPVLFNAVEDVRWRI